MTKIPPKIKKAILADPLRAHCALKGQPGHICGGRITWEHALIYAGKQIQEKWAIISLCARGHEVDGYQDARTMNKELNVWVALNQATDEELSRFSRAVPSYPSLRDRLNSKYGRYEPKFKVDPVQEMGINYGILGRENVDKYVDNLGKRWG